MLTDTWEAPQLPWWWWLLLVSPEGSVQHPAHPWQGCPACSGWCLADLMLFLLSCSSSVVLLLEVLHQALLGGCLPDQAEPLGRDMVTAAIPIGTL